MKQQLAIHWVRRSSFVRLVVVCSAVFAMLLGSASPQIANGTGNTGNLPGQVVGGTGTGTPVPVGTVNAGTGLPDVNGHCVFGQGYWINNVSSWPAIVPVTFGGVTYTTNAQLLAVLSSNSANKPYAVAKALIIALLNVGTGIHDPATDQAIADAMTWLAANPLTCAGCTDPGYGQTLGDFNSGLKGQTACDDTGKPVMFTYFCQDDQPGAFTGQHKDPNCAEGFYSSRYKWTGKKWLEEPNSYVCLTQAQCQVPAADNYHSKLPCDPFMAANGLTLVCAPRYGVRTANISAGPMNNTCPINEVLRAPYPRSLVNTETNYFLQPKTYDDPNGFSLPPQNPDNLSAFVDGNGLPTAAGYDAAIWRNFILTMRSQRFNGGENWFGQIASQPAWTFWDRSWNTGPNPRSQAGLTAQYTYGTSSAGLGTTLGQGYDLINHTPSGAYTLPSYEVDNQTSCGHQWVGSADLSERTWNKDGPCVQGTPLPTNPVTYWGPAGTSPLGCPVGQFAPGHYIYYWSNFSTTWSNLDMRQAGRATSYDLQDTARGGGQVNSSYYWDNNGGIWVPVVEVQSVLRSSCVANSSCLPPAAELTSLSP